MTFDPRRIGLVAALTALAFTTACAGSDENQSSQSATACDDRRFESDRGALAGGSLQGDQFEDVCGHVARVLRARRTRSGRHGYFYVALPAGDTIEIVSNLDAMSEAPSGDPPDWPWVAPGDYVYVQGRYYYDNASRQGIDWTEDDASSRWPHTGYVTVCDSSQAHCTTYQ